MTNIQTQSNQERTYLERELMLEITPVFDVEEVLDPQPNYLSWLGTKPENTKLAKLTERAQELYNQLYAN